MADRDTRHDKFHHQAKAAGFRARSVFKLEELDDQFKLIGPANRVLDLGCNPGSWLQYARTKTGPRGELVGIDRTPPKERINDARIIVGDVFTVSAEELLGPLPAFDVVMSDMAPDTMGVRQVDQARSEALFERAVEIAVLTLAPGGNFVGKIFQGGEFKHMIELCRRYFTHVKAAKPDSSRKISIEQYIVARDFRGTLEAKVSNASSNDGLTSHSGAMSRGTTRGSK